MKKTIALITILVLVLSCTSILLVACGKNGEDKTPSNTETIVTGAVMAASMGMGQATTTSEEEFKAGIDLTLNVDDLELSGTVKAAAQYGFGAVANVLNASISNVLNTTINSLSATLGSNSIVIEKDKNSENVFIVKTTIIEEKEEQTVQKTQELRVTIDMLDGTTIDSNEFSYNVKVEMLDGDKYIEVASFSGNAKYSETKKAMEFVIGKNNELVAYAEKDGTINIDLSLIDNENYKTTVNVSVKNGEATIVADVKATGFGEAVATINVKAGSDFKNYNIDGTFDANLQISSSIISEELIPDANIRNMINLGISLLPSKVNASGNISGKAMYVNESGFEVGLKGNISVSTISDTDKMWIR